MPLFLLEKCADWTMHQAGFNDHPAGIEPRACVEVLESKPNWLKATVPRSDASFTSDVNANIT